MTYYVNKTDGTAIAVLDGTRDTTSTSLTLIGRLSTNYGEIQNENVLHLLENFALSTSPAYPIIGQLWYDTSTNNIKAYDGSAWAVVGSSIIGNVSLTGNLFVGPNGVQIQDLGDVSITNKVSGGDISLYANIAGTNTRTLYINGGTGLVEVAANATANYGVTTKIYVDSIVTQSGSGANVALASNIATINANLAVRVTNENDLYARINAANTAITLRDTITRVNSINSAINTAINSNVLILNSTINTVSLSVTAANVSAAANVTAANIEIGNLRSNITAANIAIADIQAGLLQTNTNLSTLATKASPTFTGTPTAPTPANGTNSTRIATTEFVQTAINGIPGPNLSGAKWQGSSQFVSTTDPTSADGADGDFWFKYS
jgi:hypothetical protein